MAIEIGFAVGSVVLVCALAYGLWQYGRRDPRNERLTEAATKHVYASTER